MSGPYRDPTLNELREKYEKRIAELTEALSKVLPAARNHLRSLRNGNDPRALSLTNDIADAAAAFKEDTHE